LRTPPALFAALLVSLCSLGCDNCGRPSRPVECEKECFSGCRIAGLYACGRPCPAGTTERPNCEGGLDAATDAPIDGAADARADAPADAGTICPRVPAPVDSIRRVVISHPFAESGGQDNRYEVLALSTSGELTTGGPQFNLGRSTTGQIVFTPDGEVGLVAQTDGTLGVFRLDSAGAPTVVHAGFDGGFYAESVVVDPSGTHALVLDAEWRDIGGGVYRVTIGCDGSLSDPQLVVPAKLPHGLALRGDRALLAADDVLDSAAGQDAHLLEWGAAPRVIASTAAFSDADAIVGGTALTHDGQYFLIGDNSAFSSSPNSVAVVQVSDAALSLVQTLSPIEDPLAIVASPFDDAAIVLSGFGDAIIRLERTASGSMVFTNRDDLVYTGGRPQLPGGAAMIERGSLTGLVLVAENIAVRRVRFEGGGAVTDLGATVVGTGVAAVTGSIGVQP